MWNDPIVHFLAPNRENAPLSHRNELFYRIKRRFYNGERLIVAVADLADIDWTSKDQILGFAFWSDTDDVSKQHCTSNTLLGNGFDRLVLYVEGLYRWYFRLDRSYDKRRLAIFWHLLIDNPLFEGMTNFWELEILAIKPTFQRRGVGSMLLKWGLQQASQLGQPVIVAATTHGECLYKKHGFVELERIVSPDNAFTWAALVWYPEGKNSSGRDHP